MLILHRLANNGDVADGQLALEFRSYRSCRMGRPIFVLWILIFFQCDESFYSAAVDSRSTFFRARAGLSHIL
jgi:hypothetical protein